MAKQSYEKLIESLRTIKEECAFHGSSCGNCPLASDIYTCGVTGESTSGTSSYRRKPQYWDIPPIKLLRKKED